MEPIPESVQADQMYGPFLYEGADLLERLSVVSEEVRVVAPDCVGASLSLAEQEVTFTVVADLALLEAQQLASVARSTATGTTMTSPHDDPLSEESWAQSATGTSSSGIRSTLSLPLVRDGVATGCITLYAVTTDAFDARRDEIASILGAWAEGAVVNADLGFTSHDDARRAPQVLMESTRLSLAAGLLARDQFMSAGQAEEKLRRAAVRAGVGLPSLVDGLIEVLS